MSRLRPALWAFAAGCAVEVLGHRVPEVHADVPAPLVDVWSWGFAASGQLGAVPPNPTIPWPIQDVKRWVAVSAGSQHTLALTDTGEVWAWGENRQGELGNGTTVNSSLPVRVVDLDGVTLIAAGGSHGLAYRSSDQTLWGWGTNRSGQLGRDPSAGDGIRPVAIAGLGPLVAIAAGGSHSLALTTDGRVLSWGANEYSQLGSTDTGLRFTPAEVPLPGPATAIAAGMAHSVAALSTGGVVWGWGWNVFGQLGRGYLDPNADYGRPEPAPALQATGVVQLSAGDFHSVGRTADGQVWAWGYNTEGQVGNGEYTPANTGILEPELLTGIDAVTDIDAGGVFTVALRGGEVWAWGSDRFGECGDNGREDLHVPTRSLGASGATAVSAGAKHAVALAPPRQASVLRVVGMLGTSATIPTQRPLITDFPFPAGVAQLASGARHTLAIDGEHRVWAWGDNRAGQLGAPGGGRDVPALVDLPLDGARGFVQVVAREMHSLALRSDGVVFAWGENQWGQLGLGTTASVDGPVRVNGVTDALAIAAGERHGLALLRYGQVVAWGRNDNGQLGARPNGTVAAPATIPGLSAVSAIHAGGFHSLAVTSQGHLFAWGSGYRGQLGKENRSDFWSPEQVAMDGVTSVSAGRFHTLAVVAGGSVWAFGDAVECQVGALVLEGYRPPAPVPGVPPSLLVAAGDYHGLSWTVGGALWGWGSDAGAQLGRGDEVVSHADCDAEPIGVTDVAAVSGGLGHTVTAPR